MSKVEEKKVDKVEEKETFLAEIAQMPRVVVFNDGGFRSFGFPSDVSLVAFLLRQVYGGEGGNVIFQEILARLEQRSLSR